MSNMVRVPVQPQMLRWAADRVGMAVEDARARFAKFDEWMSGTLHPTLNQLQDFANATHTPFGYFFLPNPPTITLPIPDFRTHDGERPDEPSPDLLDTLFLCQQRQEWYSNYARSIGSDPLPFVGSVTIGANVFGVARAIRSMLDFDLSARRHMSTWEDALRQFIQVADDAGILVMVNGVVGGNNTRKLDTGEFRGFALTDPLAPLVFINGADTKSAQMFTLAHELAHIWLGQSALSDITVGNVAPIATERWCDAVAAEVLVPLEQFTHDYNRSASVDMEMQRLARMFKVSTLVVLRRMRDAGGIANDEFWELFHAEVARLMAIMAAKAGGGDYYRTTTARVSARFTRAVVTSTVEGRSTFNEAFRLLGCKKVSTFAELGRHVGVDTGLSFQGGN
jgi:Zn-dependent peptidase ImmA (M78 family)